MDFKITAPFEPDGDQPQAIEKLAERHTLVLDTLAP